MIQIASRRSVRASALLVPAVVVALVAGCGNRQPHEAVVAVGNGYGPVAVDPAAAAGAAVGTAPGQVAAPGAVASGPAPSVAAVAPGAVAAPAPGASSAPAAGAGAGGQKATTESAVEARCPSVLSPIRLGQTLASSGLVGASIGGLRTGRCGMGP